MIETHVAWFNFFFFSRMHFFFKSLVSTISKVVIKGIMPFSKTTYYHNILSVRSLCLNVKKIRALFSNFVLNIEFDMEGLQESVQT